MVRSMLRYFRSQFNDQYFFCACLGTIFACRSPVPYKTSVGRKEGRTVEKSVEELRNSSEDSGSGGRVAFSTPVSSIKQRNREEKNKIKEEKPVVVKSTRFDLPPPSSISHSAPDLHMDSINGEEHRSPEGISPIKTPAASGNSYTPYRSFFLLFF